jgi:hypothetical protein
VLHRYHGSSERHGRAWLLRKGRINRVRTLLKNASWRMLLRATPRTFSNSLGLLFGGGPGALAELYTAARGALRARREVNRMRSLSAREVERAWVQQ